MAVTLNTALTPALERVEVVARSLLGFPGAVRRSFDAPRLAADVRKPWAMCRSVLICSDSALNQGQAFCIIGKGPRARRRWQRDRLRSRLKIREPNHATAIPTIAAAVR